MVLVLWGFVQSCITLVCVDGLFKLLWFKRSPNIRLSVTSRLTFCVKTSLEKTRRLSRLMTVIFIGNLQYFLW